MTFREFRDKEIAEKFPGMDWNDVFGALDREDIESISEKSAEKYAIHRFKGGYEAGYKDKSDGAKHKFNED